MSSESQFKSVGGLARLGRAWCYSWQGLKEAWRVEAAFRQELCLCALLVPLALCLPVSALERAVLLGVLLLLLIVELLNSALEAVVDRISLEHHELSRRAKDFGSAAVLLSLLLVALLWVTILLPLLLSWF